MNPLRFLATAALICFSMNSHSARAQDYPNNVHQQTSTPTNARYEIVQSELAARLTFRLDRFAGRISQLVHTKDGNNAWQSTYVRELPTINSPTYARFQIFTSGIAARHTFLIDTDTGKTWALMAIKGKNPDGTEFDDAVWAPFED